MFVDLHSLSVGPFAQAVLKRPGTVISDKISGRTKRTSLLGTRGSGKARSPRFNVISAEGSENK